MWAEMQGCRQVSPTCKLRLTNYRASPNGTSKRSASIKSGHRLQETRFVARQCSENRRVESNQNKVLIEKKRIPILGF
jgi:hypothetical protein